MLPYFAPTRPIAFPTVALAPAAQALTRRTRNRDSQHPFSSAVIERGSVMQSQWWRTCAALLCAAALGVFAPDAAVGQVGGTADMTGRGLDQQGAVLPGGTLLFRSPDS